MMISSKNGFIKVFIFCLILITIKSNAQKIITVNFATSVDTIKDLLGGNRGKSFDPNTIQIKHDEGIKFIRTHDFHGILDYSDYSDFWNTDGLGHDTINLSFDPYNPSDYHWNVADSIINLIISNNFKIFFPVGCQLS